MTKRSSDEVRRTMEEIVEEAAARLPDSDIDPPEASGELDSEKSSLRVTSAGIDDAEASDSFSLRKPARASLPQHGSAPSKPGASNGQAETFSPRYKPKTPILYLMDDNQETAEAIRLRGMQTLIGRSRGDILLSNDAHVSDRHAEIRRELKGDTFSWVLNDLKSTNGTYVQIQKQGLTEGDCLLFGGKYFRFSKADSELSGRSGSEQYALVQFAYARGEQPSVFMLDRSKENVIGNKQSWSSGQTWKDEFLDAEHAKIVCGNGGRWTVEDLASVNGTWIKTQSLALIDGISFQLGGQRFIFSIDG